MPALITTDLVALDADLGADKGAVVRRLAELVAAAGRATDADALHADVLAREAQAATGLPGGIAIPHCRSGGGHRGLARPSPGSRPTVDFGAPDGPADLAFLIAAPAHGDADHLTLLTALARALVRPEFVASLRAAASGRGDRRLVQDVVSPAPEPARSRRTGRGAGPAPPPRPRLRRPPQHRRRSAPARPASRTPTWPPTSSPPPAQAAGVDVHVETQGSSGSTPLDPAVIRAADAVIFAVDVGVKDQERFAGKPVVQSRHQAGHQRARGDDPRGAGRRRRPERPPGGRHRRRSARQRPPRRGGARPRRRGDPPLAAHRRQLHDPVRRGRRSAHRAGLPARRLPDRATATPTPRDRATR